MIIIGAGLSGLLAGALNPGSTIYEAGEEKEDNHQALFRCRSDQIGKILGLPFREVQVNKSIWMNGQEVQPTPRIIHMYSYKTSGKITNRSIYNIDSGVRFTPPENFVEELKKRCNIVYGKKIIYKVILDFKKDKVPIISTVPMPLMLPMLGYREEEIKFNFKPIYVNKLIIDDCSTNCTVYYPSEATSIYRASIVDNMLIIESNKPLYDTDDFNMVINSMGLPRTILSEQVLHNYEQKFGKITTIRNITRELIITNWTMKYGVYSLGRYATWRPKVMLDDVLEDIFQIRKMIHRGNYGILKHEQNEAK